MKEPEFEPIAQEFLDLIKDPEDEPGKNIIYCVNEDDSLGIMNKRVGEPMPEGFAPLPFKWKDDGTIFYDNGNFTVERRTPEEDAAIDAAEMEIEKKMRTLAIKELKREGKIPGDYKEE